MKISGISMVKNSFNEQSKNQNPSFKAGVQFDKDSVDILSQPKMVNVREGFYFFQKWAKEFLNQDPNAMVWVSKAEGASDELMLSSNPKGYLLRQPWKIDPYRDSIDVFKDLRTTVFEAFNHLTKDPDGKKICLDVNFKRTPSAELAHQYNEQKKEAAKIEAEPEEWEPNSNYTGDYVHPTPLTHSEDEFELGIIK